MKRHGKELKTLADGHPRRLSDGRNAWKKMNDEQRETFLEWMLEEVDGRALPVEMLNAITVKHLTPKAP